MDVNEIKFELEGELYVIEEINRSIVENVRKLTELEKENYTYASIIIDQV